MVATSVPEALDALEELFSDASRWTQGALAKTQKGTKLANVHSRYGTAWCLLGGCELVTTYKNDYLNRGLYNATLYKLADAAYDIYPDDRLLINVNDRLGLDAVRKVIHRAKELVDGK